MKPRQLLSFFTVMIVFAITSCQKQYERPDITLPGGSGNSGGGTGGGTGSLLIKAESKTTGNTTEGSVTNYEYDGGNRLVKMTIIVTDSSNQTRTVGYRYVRDGSGKITRIVSNVLSAGQPGAGFPDSIYVDVHYPTGSANFDYAKFSMDFGGGLLYMDSVAYKYSGNTLTARTEYAGFAGLGSLSVSQHQTFDYINQNLATIKTYTSTSASALAATLSMEYDSKNQTLYMGNEAFLLGMSEGCVSKNNPSKETMVDNSNNSIVYLVDYTMQYNAGGYPTSGTLVLSKPTAKTQNLKFTYK